MPVEQPTITVAPAPAPTRWSQHLGATAYGLHLELVLRAALATCPGLWSAAEHALAQALTGAPWADLVSRISQRSAQRLPLAELAGDAPELRTAISSGWLQLEAHALALAGPAAAFIAGALVVAFGGEREDLSFFPRLALGRLVLPPGSPVSARLQTLLRGELPSPYQGPLPAALRSRAALDDYLRACQARALGADGQAATCERFEQALAAVTALAGEPWELMAAQLTAAAQWTHLLWDCRQALPADDPRSAAALRALRRAPLSPALARRLWDAVHRRAHARSGRFIAGHIAQFALWNPGQRARYLTRSRPPGARRAPAGRWRIEHLSAWLERDRSGAVVAHGEGVEAHALRRLARDGWQGIHGEGEFWSDLATLMFWDEVMAPTAGAWVGPLQAWPLDWRRYGFVARRAAALSQRAVQLVRDPLQALHQASARLVEDHPLGAARWPSAAAAEAVCRLMPRAALLRLLQRVLADPGAVSGLPDLITWRGEELVLWEVKSPNDQLSDRQRAWLSWLDHEGIQVGELRIDARTPTQGTLFASPAVGATDATLVPLVRPRARRQAPRPAPSHPARLTALAGRGWACAVSAGGVLPGDAPPLSDPPTLALEQWNGSLGERAVASWDRPVLALYALPAQALLLVSTRGRTVVGRRWYPLGEGSVIPLVVSAQASPRGGVAECATILMRRSGWIIPADVADHEPVVATADEVSQVNAGARACWQIPPDCEPLRIEALAQAWGFAEDLEGQLALLGSQAYQLALGARPGTITLSLAEDACVLWTVSSPCIERQVLEAARTRSDLAG